MPQHRARSASRARLIAGGAALAGTALIGLSGAAQAATPDLVPDLGPILSSDSSGPANDDQPDPAPTAPPIESSYEAFDSDQPIQQLRDFAPAGVPAAGLVDVVSKAPKQIAPPFLSGGAGE
ncbi:hypothetical protein [Pseudonocardia alni]|uniref:Uncharacterized protein n=1 Tax=Pseudonocardia alni TaxID=33907 RepID=A0AA44ZRF5_PSEA5|nr:hypothetical protein [Pseudonocardia alni]PKB32961.1 hypothetical protein ATL51_4708 [Pseudonocardia alni]